MQCALYLLLYLYPGLGRSRRCVSKQRLLHTAPYSQADLRNRPCALRQPRTMRCCTRCCAVAAACRLLLRGGSHLPGTNRRTARRSAQHGPLRRSAAPQHLLLHRMRMRARCPDAAAQRAASICGSRGRWRRTMLWCSHRVPCTSRCGKRCCRAALYSGN